jgi:hypothetical protein
MPENGAAGSADSRPGFWPAIAQPECCRESRERQLAPPSSKLMGRFCFRDDHEKVETEDYLSKLGRIDQMNVLSQLSQVE